MSYPVIGITTRTAPVPPSLLPSVLVQKSYVDAILAAGGLPVLIPSDIDSYGWKIVAERFDGILFTGGGDIALNYFDGEPHAAVYGIDAPRDAIEIGLTKYAVDESIPFLGICRGLQVVNVALGGSLYTHIPDQLINSLVHDYPGEDGVPARTAIAHQVVIENTSILGEILGEKLLYVNSLHHQGIKDVAPGLKAVGISPDGLVEAIELSDHPFGIAVQWHPEWLTDQEPTKRLFAAFVEAAKKRSGIGNAN